MAFPVIAASNSSVQATNATSHTVNLPASIASGNLLVASVITDARPNLSGSLVDNWTQLTADAPGNDAIRLYLFFRNASGSEGSTVAFDTATAQCSAHRTYRITGHHESTNPFAGGNNAVDSSTSINPGAVNPSTWDVEDTLWIFFCGHDDGTTTVTGFPTDYVNTGQIAGGDAADGVNLAWCTRENAIASEDPSAFTLSVAEAVVSFGVAIRPSATVPPITPPVTDATVTLFQPLVQNTTLQPESISAFASFAGTAPTIVLVVLPAVVTAAATVNQPTVINLGTTQNIDPTTINAGVVMNSLIGIFLVGPVTQPAISAPATFFQPFVGTDITPALIIASAVVQAPTVNLFIQFIDLDRIVSGMFVFSPNVLGEFMESGLKQTVRDFPKTALVGEPSFAASVSDTAKVAVVEESAVAILLDQES